MMVLSISAREVARHLLFSVRNNFNNLGFTCILFFGKLISLLRATEKFSKNSVNLFKIVCVLLNKITIVAGWSSPVARQAHNLKNGGSNPSPAT